MGEISIPIVEALPTIDLRDTFDGHPLRGYELGGLIKRKKRKRRAS